MDTPPTQPFIVQNSSKKPLTSGLPWFLTATVVAFFGALPTIFYFIISSNNAKPEEWVFFEQIFWGFIIILPISVAISSIVVSLITKKGTRLRTILLNWFLIGLFIMIMLIIGSAFL